MNKTLLTCTVATVTWSRVTVRVSARAQQESEARTEARSGEWGAVRPEYQLVTPSTHRNWICMRIILGTMSISTKLYI